MLVHHRLKRRRIDFSNVFEHIMYKEEDGKAVEAEEAVVAVVGMPGDATRDKINGKVLDFHPSIFWWPSSSPPPPPPPPPSPPPPPRPSHPPQLELHGMSRLAVRRR